MRHTSIHPSADRAIDPARAQIISDELTGIPDLAAADRAVIEHDALAAAAAGHTGAQVRDRIRRALLAVTPDDAAERHQQARRRRRVCTMPQPDGMGELWGYLPADTIIMIDTVLNGYTTPARDHPAGDRPAGTDSLSRDTRSRDERRADALADIFRAILDSQPLPTTRGGAWTPPPLPARHGRRPHLVITIAASTLACTDDQPATLAGYRPVPADIARHLAADAGTYQTACVDDTGTCQWIGKTTPYRPAQWMVDQVVTRDPVCRHPDCRRPAAQCEVDHATRHPDAPTCPCNLMPLCAFRQRRKHRALQAAGIPTGGTRPFGWKADKRALDEGEAEEIRTAARRLLEGAPLSAVVADWNGRGVRTSLGNTWSVGTLTSMLRNPRLAGQRGRTVYVYNPETQSENRHMEIVRKPDGSPVPGLWEPVLSVAEWEALIAVIGDRYGPARRGRNSRTYLLSSMLRCSKEDCGKNLRCMKTP